LETQEDHKYIYQNFRLVTSNSKLLKFFTNDKYTGFHELDEALRIYYIGDGENIIFRKKTIYNNLVVITYERLNDDIKYDNSEKNFDVITTIPFNNGCISCEYFRKKNRICMYAYIVGIKIKKSCEDFKQKDSESGKYGT